MSDIEARAQVLLREAASRQAIVDRLLGLAGGHSRRPAACPPRCLAGICEMASR